MTSRQRLTTLTTVIILITLVALLLTGCGVKFPKDDDAMLSAAGSEWGSADSRTVNDKISIKEFKVSVPVKIANIDKSLTLTMNSGEININRSITADQIDITMSVKNLKAEVDNSLKDFLPKTITLSNLNRVTMDITAKLTPNKMTITSTTLGMNTVIDGELPEIKSSQELSDASYTSQYTHYRTIAAMPLFGTVQTEGVLSKEYSSYVYSLPSKKVNDELFRLPKILLESVSPVNNGTQTVSLLGLMQKYFESTDLIAVVNSILIPTDMRITTTLNKGAKGYYFNSYTGNYIAGGNMSKSASERIFDDVIASMQDSPNASLVNQVALAGSIRVELKMSIQSSLRIIN